MSRPARGEVWLCERPHDKRPVLILTRDEAIDALNRVIAVPSTRRVRDIPSHVTLDTDDGMREPCALALDNTFAPLKAHLTRRITKLDTAKMRDVCRALNAATGC
jgi:mRNA-degrading endonuclease toxin of MazEF toxin-antitoxin module